MVDDFSLKARVGSFRHAFVGVLVMLRSQHNAWIHLVATVVVIAAGFWLNVSARDWCLLVLAMVAVWTAEGLNTAFEFLADAASPDFHPLVKKAKDVAAGAVLITAVGAAVVGVVVFLPYV